MSIASTMKSGGASVIGAILKKIKLVFLAMKTGLFLLFVFFLAGLAFTFMGTSDQTCYFPYTHAEERAVVTVNANNDNWTETNVSVSEREILDITFSGDVKLCTGTRRIGVRGDTFIKRPSNDFKWQPTGAYARQGAPIQFSIKETYSQFPDNTCVNDLNPTYSPYIDVNGERTTDTANGTRTLDSGRWNDNTTTTRPCFSKNGQGLFIHIGEPDGGLETDTFDNPLFEGKGDRFFELYEYREEAQGPYLTNINGIITLENAPADGQIYIRYGEIDPATTDTTNAQWQWPSAASASDNRDGYDIKIESTCPAKNGEYLIGFIGETAPTGTGDNSGFLDLSAVSGHSYAGQFVGESPSAGKLFLKIIDVASGVNNSATGDGVYLNNEGNYSVTIKVERNPNIRFFDNLIEPVRILLYGTEISQTTSNGQGNTSTTVIKAPGVPEALFRAISANGNLNLALQACMILAITLYGFMYISTGAGGTLREILTLSFKLGIIIALLDPNSWDFFYTYLLQGLIGAIDDLSAIMIGAINQNLRVYQTGELIETVLPNNGTGNIVGGIVGMHANIDQSFNATNNVFGFLGKIIDFIIQGPTWLRILSLITHSLLGVFLIYVIVVSIILFFSTVFRALLTYLASMLLLSILIGLGPIFIGFILFNRTKKFFDSWLRTILYYILQPVFLLSLVGIFAIIFYSYLHSTLNYGTCFECLYSWPALSPYIPGMPAWCLIANFRPWVLDGDMLARTTNDGITAITLFIIAWAMNKLPDLAHAFAVRFSNAGGLSDSIHVADKAGVSEQAIMNKMTAPLSKETGKEARQAVINSIPGAGRLMTSGANRFSKSKGSKKDK